jgi:hypothetical protein
MKKAFTLVVLIVTARIAFAQGTVQFNNLSAVGPIMRWTSMSDSTLVSVAKSSGTTVNGRVEVLAYYNSTVASLTPLFTVVPRPGFGVQLTQGSYSSLANYLAANPGWAAVATVAIGSLQNGVFDTGVLTIGTDNPGANVSYAILGWTGSYTTFDAAYAAAVMSDSAFFGISPVFTTTSGNPFTTPPGTASSISTTFTGIGSYGLAPIGIPEPTGFALAGLGLAALLVFRRRR